ncbi:MAG: ArnT family glycosyltransferase [Acidobacteriaceae bacterium]
MEDSIDRQQVGRGGVLLLARRLRLPALFCSVAVLFCAFASRPYTTMGIQDDGPYIQVAQKLAGTGHILYNGWETPMLGVQLLLNVAFFKLFGSSFTVARMSTLMVACLMAFFLQRTLVRVGIGERNATLGTLTLVLSPVYLMFAATGMTDITCLFGIILCLYGCLSALQAAQATGQQFSGLRRDLPALLWLCFAIAASVLCGTARQLSWLGLLLIVPSTLYLLGTQGSLRSRRWPLLAAGGAATLFGVAVILACEAWFSHQPYVEPGHMGFNFLPGLATLRAVFRFLLKTPLYLLPLVAVFLPQIRRGSPRVLFALFAGYLLLGFHPLHPRPLFLFQPADNGCFSIYGINWWVLPGALPLFLPQGVQILLALVTAGGLIGMAACYLRTRGQSPAAAAATGISWKQLGLLLGPFTLAYIALLVPRTASYGLFDRYLLPLLVFVTLAMVRFYQERVRPQLPSAAWVLVAIMAAYSIATTHNNFSLYRARVALAAEVNAAGVPDTSVDNGWEYNYVVELQHSSHINDPRIVLPAHAYVPVPPPPAYDCWAKGYHDSTPHIHPLYGVTFDPNRCYGLAPFAPVHFSRWPYRTPGTIYVVRFVPPPKS